MPTLVVQVRFYARANSSGQYPSIWTGTAQVDLNEQDTTSIRLLGLQEPCGRGSGLVGFRCRGVGGRITQLVWRWDWSVLLGQESATSV